MQRALVRKVFSHPLYFIAFGFGAGLSPFAPGTCGTLVAIPLYCLIQSFSLLNYSLVLLLAVILGILICDLVEREMRIHDYSGIVWDEICGFGLTMLAAPQGWFWIIVGFLLFRCFDIVKPWPITWIDRELPGGFGIMLDDVMAAVYAWLGLHGLAYLAGYF